MWNCNSILRLFNIRPKGGSVGQIAALKEKLYKAAEECGNDLSLPSERYKIIYDKLDDLLNKEKECGRIISHKIYYYGMWNRPDDVGIEITVKFIPGVMAVVYKFEFASEL